jgi:drug/metabolite transporter (DMT)-like permease
LIADPLALGSSLVGGVSDFLAGTLSRRLGTLRTMFWLQFAGVLFAGVWVILSAEPLPSLGAVMAAAGAGACLTVGLAALFQAMVVGTMSIVAPISATGVAVPVIAGAVAGERLGTAQAIGIAGAVAGVVLTTRRPRADSSSGRAAGVELALLSALGCGLFFWLVAVASRHGLAWTILIARSVSSAMLAPRAQLGRRPHRPFEWRTVGWILASSILAFAAVSLYAGATVHGELAIVSVLASLFPIVTIVLANRVLGERVYGRERVGIIIVVISVVLIAGA